MKRLLVVLLAVMMMSGTALAWNLDDHITEANDEKGDAMVFPVVIAKNGGWETKLTVINTDLTRGVVAKVVVRSGVFSQELLDFFIYLTPADVWTGVVRMDIDGDPEMYSTDPSCKNLAGVFASEADPFQVKLDHQNSLCIPPDTDEEVYIEVLEAWASEPVYQPQGFDYGGLSGPPAVELAYDDDPLSFPDDETENVLTGIYEIKNAAAGLWASNLPKIFKDHDINERLDVLIESAIGLQARNNLCEVEAVSTMTALHMPYYYNFSAAGLQTIHMITLYTKLTQLADCLITNHRGPFFQVPNRLQPGPEGTECVEYSIKFFDTEENTPAESGVVISPVPEEERDFLCRELNFLYPANWRGITSMYDEGWVNYGFGPYTTSCDPAGLPGDPLEIAFTGLPATGTTAYWNASGLTLSDAAFTRGDVTYLGTAVPEYPEAVGVIATTGQ